MADIAVVMTNRYFTKQAKSDARSLGVRLWDRNKLKNLISFADNKKNRNSDYQNYYLNNDIKSKNQYDFPETSETEKAENDYVEKNQ